MTRKTLILNKLEVIVKIQGLKHDKKFPMDYHCKSILGSSQAVCYSLQEGKWKGDAIFEIKYPIFIIFNSTYSEMTNDHRKCSYDLPVSNGFYRISKVYFTHKLIGGNVNITCSKTH
jgi:hypothetical protein